MFSNKELKKPNEWILRDFPRENTICCVTEFRVVFREDWKKWYLQNAQWVQLALY